MEISKKVILVGHFGVGKTSLVSQFVHQKFSDHYLTTIGVKIDKKLVEFDGSKVNLILWDIAGETTSSKVPKNYIAGAQGILYVFDTSRPETYENITDDLFVLQKELPNVAVTVLGNKSDLVDQASIEKISGQMSFDVLFTSAKSGENVEEAFKALTKRLL